MVETIRVLILAPIAVLVIAVAGHLTLTQTGRDPHVREMLLASAIAVVASAAAVLPLWLTRGADQAATAQAGLVATIAHLFVAVGLAGGVILGLRTGLPFTLWMLAFYWATLIVVVAAAVRTVRTVPPTAQQ